MVAVSLKKKPPFASRAVAEHYLAKRKVPKENLVLLDLPMGEDMDGKVIAGIYENPPAPLAKIPSWDAVPGDQLVHAAAESAATQREFFAVLIANIEASNLWAFFQAKSIRQTSSSASPSHAAEQQPSLQNQ